MTGGVLMRLWQKIQKRIAVLSCVAMIAGSGIAAAQVVTVNGYGDDRGSAINDAKRNAVEQAIGSYLQSTTIINNGNLLLDDIYARSIGFVRNIQILSEGNEKGQYHIIASIDISDEFKSEAQKQIMTVASLNNPRIGIRLSGMNKGRKIASHYMKMIETDIVQYLLGKGMTHIIILDDRANMGTDISFVNEAKADYGTEQLAGSMEETSIDSINTSFDNDSSELSADDMGNMPLDDIKEPLLDDNTGTLPVYDTGNLPSDDTSEPSDDTSEPPADNYEDYTGNEDDTGIVFNVSDVDNIQLEENMQVSLANSYHESKKVDFILDGTLIVNSGSIRLPDYKTMAKANVKFYDTGLMKVNMIFQGTLNHADTGEVMGEVKVNTMAMDNTSEDAMLKGIGALSPQIGERIWNLFKQSSAIMPHSLSVSIRCKEYDKVLVLSEKLRSQSGIQGVTIRDYKDGVATLSVDTEITASQLFKIMKSYNDIFITMENQSNGILEINMG